MRHIATCLPLTEARIRQVGTLMCGLHYLFVGVQEEAPPDGAQPRGGEHAAPRPAAGGPGAAEQRHDGLQQHHGVVQGEEQAV